jgi:dipeptidyl aminopeptidase/acylaminoacyl peptidase
LVTLAENLPLDWKAEIPWFRKMLGADERTETGRDFLHSQSPVHFASQIKRPLLIGHGANDPRVKRFEADQVFNAMKEVGLPATYALFSGEGHYLQQLENKRVFAILVRRFLAKHLKDEVSLCAEGEFSGSLMHIYRSE